MNILDKLVDLHIQATVERSHNYTGAVIREAIVEIDRLQLEIDRLQEFEWMYEGLSK